MIKRVLKLMLVKVWSMLISFGNVSVRYLILSFIALVGFIFFLMCKLPVNSTIVPSHIYNTTECIYQYKSLYEHMVIHADRPTGSESDEDQIIYQKFFRDFREGIYVELGAFDGVEASNTLLFEFCLGWRGLLIEPGLDTFARLEVNRPNNKHVHAAIGCEGSVKFVDHGWTAMRMDGKELGKLTGEVSCMSLQDVFDDWGEMHVNFFSLDVETQEPAVLKTIDFDKMRFDVILIESDKSGEETREIMRERTEYIIQTSMIPRSDVYIHKDIKQTHS